MKSKSVLRRLEQLEKRAMPQRENIGILILDHEPTAEELAEIYKQYGNVPIIYADKLED